MLFLFFFVIICGFFFPKSKIVVGIQILLCGVIFSFNTDNPDYIGYLGTFESVSVGGEFYIYFQAFAPLYKLLVYMCDCLDMSFNIFRMFVFMVCSSLILSTVKKITANIGFVISMYMIFPFVMDCIQIRNFIGESFVIYAFRFLIDDDNLDYKKNAIKFTFWIIIASLFHYTALVYMIYLMKFLRGYKFFMAYTVGLIVSCVSVVLLQSYIIVETIYVEQHVSFETFTFMSGITLMILCVLYKYRKRIDKWDRGSLRHLEIYNILKVSTIFMPLLVFHFDLFRFIRNVLVIFSCYAGEYFSRIKDSWGEVVLSKALIFIVFVLCYGLLLWRSAYYPYDISLLDRMLNSIEFTW